MGNSTGHMVWIFQQVNDMMIKRRVLQIKSGKCNVTPFFAKHKNTVKYIFMDLSSLNREEQYHRIIFIFGCYFFFNFCFEENSKHVVEMIWYLRFALLTNMEEGIDGNNVGKLLKIIKAWE